MAISYDSAIQRAAEFSPTVEAPTQFIAWAESIVELICAIYHADYEQTTSDMYEAAKEHQGYESNEDEDD